MRLIEWFRSLLARPEPPRSGGGGASGTWEPAKPLPRGLRNKNPGNIRGGPAKWKGEVGRDRDGFVIFDSDEMGLRACARLLMTYRSRYGLDCVEEIVGRWAPASENNTRAYVKAVSDALGVPPLQIINVYDIGTLTALVSAIVRHENGRNPYSPSQIRSAVAMALEGA